VVGVHALRGLRGKGGVGFWGAVDTLWQRGGQEPERPRA